MLRFLLLENFFFEDEGKVCISVNERHKFDIYIYIELPLISSIWRPSVRKKRRRRNEEEQFCLSTIPMEEAGLSRVDTGEEKMARPSSLRPALLAP